jgi:outer membrane protein assembly factor BamB
VSALAQANFVSSADLAVQGFVVSVAGRIQSDVADLDVVSALTATVTRNRGHSAALTSAFIVTAEGLDLDLATAALTSAFALTASATRIRRSAVALNSAVTTTASANKIISDWRSYHWGWGLRQGAVPGSGGVYQHIFSRSSAVDDNENVYELSTRWTEQTSPLNALLLVKRTSQGEVVWKKQFDLGVVGFQNHPEHAKITYFNGYLYISTSYYTTFPAWESRIWKLDLDGARQWGRVSFKIVDHYVDSTGVYFLSGLTTSDVYKLNDSTGTTAWIGQYSQTVSNIPMSITGDVDYIYFSTEDPHIFALNKSTGAQVWRRRLDLVSSERDRLNHLDINADDELVIAHNKGDGTSYIVDINTSTGAANSSKNINKAVNELFIDEYTGQHYVLSTTGTNAAVVYALNDDLTVGWSRRFLVSTLDDLERMWYVAFNEYHLYLGGVGIDFDLGGGASYLLKTKKDGGTDYTNAVLRTPYSGTFEFTDAGDPTITTASVSSITSTTGTYSTTTGNLSTDSTNWTTESSTIDYEWINVVDGLSVGNTASFTVAAIPTYIRNANAAISSQATFSAQPTVVKKGEAALSSAATVTANNARTRGVNANITAQATLTTNVARTRGIDASVSAQVTVTPIARKTASAGSAVSSAFAIASTLLRIRQSAIATESVATQLSAVAKVGSALVTIETASTLNCDAFKAVIAQGNLSSNFAVSAEASLVKEVSANLQSAVTVTASINRTRSVLGSFTTQATVTADVTKVIFADAVLTVASQLAAAPIKTTFVSASITSVVILSATPNAELFITAGLSNAFAFNAVGRFIVNGGANLTAFNTVLSTGTVIQLDPYLTYLVEAESRNLVITGETRLFTVIEESRNYMITEETREYAVEQQSAVNII